MPETQTLDAHPGRKALAHTRRVLEQRPHKDDAELTLATQSLAVFRKELLDRQRRTVATAEDRDRLSRLNAIISVVMAMHFPIGNPQWGEFEKTQVWLTDLVEELEA